MGPELLILALVALVAWGTYRTVRWVAMWVGRRINPPVILTLGETTRFAPGDVIVVNNDRRRVVSIVGRHSMTVRDPWPWERS